ncbi:MAG: NADH-quinone oxidoreductase subunit M, partial [Terriglobia bacterium]
MILVWLLAILLVAGVLAWFAGRWSKQAPRWISLIATSIDFVIGLVLWSRFGSEMHLASHHNWVEQVNWRWVPQLGIRFHLALD